MPSDPETERGTNGHAEPLVEDDTLKLEPRWGEPPDRRPPRRAATTGEVVARRRGRLSGGAHLMAAVTARRFGVDPESKLRWLPISGLVLALLVGLASLVMGYWLWRGRVEERADALAANQLATTATINASEARLTRAAEKLEQSAKDMRTEMNAKVGAIDDKVDSIRGAVSDWRAEQSAELAGLRAQLEAANDDKGRLWQSLETYRLKLERLEREQRAAPAQPPPNSTTPQH